MANDLPGARKGAGQVQDAVPEEPRGLHPDHRRDGIGLLLVALGLIVSAAIFHKMPGWLGDGLYAFVAGAVGCVAWAIPLLLFGLAVNGVGTHSPIVQGDPMGPFWLTGGAFGLARSPIPPIRARGLHGGTCALLARPAQDIIRQHVIIERRTPQIRTSIDRTDPIGPRKSQLARQ